MPTTVVETDAFVASLQRPNNGELADAASILLYLQHLTNSRRWLYNRGRSALFDITRAPFSADPTGGVASTTGMQAAIAAAAAAGGHVFSPPGNFRHGLLTIPAGVSIFGVPDKTYWLHDHATANGLVFLDYNEVNPVTIHDIRFMGNVAGTGKHVVNNVGARVVFDRCAWNGFTSGGAPSNNLTGMIVEALSNLSEMSFLDCEVRVAGDVDAVKTNGRLTIRGGKVIMPATYSAGRKLITAKSGTPGVLLDGVEYDGSAHVAGAAAFVHAEASSFLQLRGSRIKGNSGNEALLTWDADAKIIEEGTLRLDVINGLLYASTAKLARGSRLAGMPGGPYLDFGGSVTATVPTGLSAVFLGFTGTVPTITLPPAVWLGQRLRLLIKNGSGSGWTAPGVTPITVLAFGKTVPALPAFSGPLVLDLEVVDDGATAPTPNLVWALVDA